MGPDFSKLNTGRQCAFQGWVSYWSFLSFPCSVQSHPTTWCRSCTESLHPYVSLRGKGGIILKWSTGPSASMNITGMDIHWLSKFHFGRKSPASSRSHSHDIRGVLPKYRVNENLSKVFPNLIYTGSSNFCTLKLQVIPNMLLQMLSTSDQASATYQHGIKYLPWSVMFWLADKPSIIPSSPFPNPV